MKQNWMVFLRAVNVGGKNLVPMAKLKQVLENEGYTSVITYLQSGNIILHTDNQDQKGIEKQISELIFANFSVSVAVFARSVESVKTWLEENPFHNPEQFPGDKVGIALLSHLPEDENLAKLYSITFTPDKFLIKGSILYLYCPEGFGKTRFTSAMIESKLKVRITVRNRKTIEALSKMVSENP
jgi:uncharacterized protein (DUF1697 family)